MFGPQQALGAALRPLARPATTVRRALLAGGGGPLGSAMLEQALGAGLFAQVQVLVGAPVAPGLRSFQALPLAALQDATTELPDTAFVIFDRQRGANGREAAFHCPAPAQLPALAQRLRAGGVRTLLVLMPHAPALLPAALKQGLANLDEQAVAALGFEHLVFVRPAQAALGDSSGGSLPERVAAAVLSQLSWMVPQREQPLRAPVVAQFVLELARRLPAATPGTRVLNADVLWACAQPGGGTAVLQAWLDGRAAPAVKQAVPRL